MVIVSTKLWNLMDLNLETIHCLLKRQNPVNPVMALAGVAGVMAAGGVVGEMVAGGVVGEMVAGVEDGTVMEEAVVEGAVVEVVEDDLVINLTWLRLELVHTLILL